MWKYFSKNTLSSETEEKVRSSFEKMWERSDVGFKDFEQFQSLKSQVTQLKNHKKVTAVFGIGGSSMGAKAIMQALDPVAWRDQCIFFDNVDVLSFEKKLQKIKDPEQVNWVIISKSGSTIETLSCYDFCLQYFQEKFSVDIRQNTVAITEEKESVLFNFAQQNNIKVLPVPQNIGGRFSVFTPVGLYPLASQGVSLEGIESGVKESLGNKSLVCQMAGDLFESLQRKEYYFYSFYYTDRLVHWGEWLQQLWSESLAKAVDNHGRSAPVLNTFIPCRGATYQHSVLQQVAEGQGKKLVCFIRTEDAEKGSDTLKASFTGNTLLEGKSLGQLLSAEADATEQALQEKGIVTMRLSTKELNAEAVGSLMMTWMLVVGTLGELLEIDAYNQPGVESGKRLARQFLSSSS